MEFVAWLVRYYSQRESHTVVGRTNVRLATVVDGTGMGPRILMRQRNQTRVNRLRGVRVDYLSPGMDGAVWSQKSRLCEVASISIGIDH